MSCAPAGDVHSGCRMHRRWNCAANGVDDSRSTLITLSQRHEHGMSRHTGVPSKQLAGIQRRDRPPSSDTCSAAGRPAMRLTGCRVRVPRPAAPHASEAGGLLAKLRETIPIAPSRCPLDAASLASDAPALAGATAYLCLRLATPPYGLCRTDCVGDGVGLVGALASLGSAARSLARTRTSLGTTRPSHYLRGLSLANRRARASSHRLHAARGRKGTAREPAAWSLAALPRARRPRMRAERRVAGPAPGTL
jgi:hypothetical protein